MAAGATLLQLDQQAGQQLGRELTWRYVIALALIASLSTAAWLSLHLVIREQKSAAALVNISGRQRMLSQRATLLANQLVTAGKEARPALRTRLGEVVDLMESSHHALLYGNQSLGLPDTMSAQVHGLYFDGKDALNTQVELFIYTLRALLQEQDSKLNAQNEYLQYVTRQASHDLLSALDNMVHQYQLEGEAAVQRTARAETIVWVITLLLLALEVMLIFRPFVRHIRNAVNRLQQATEELAQHESRLAEQVGERTAQLMARNSDLAQSLAQNRRLTDALDNVAAYVYMKNRKHQYTYANKLTLDLFGCTEAELAGAGDERFFPPETVARLHAIDDRVLERGESTSEEVVVISGGTERVYLELKTPLYDEQGKIVGLYGISYDISDRKRLEHELERQAHIDYLTGVNNRGHFMTLAEKELTRVERYGKSLSLLMLDIDWFKQINDSHGHKAGDIVLKSLAEICRRTLREVDIIGRIGGEEFAVILPETDLQGAEDVAWRMCDAVAATSIPIESGLPVSVTISIGVSTRLSSEDNIDMLLYWADQALYRAKEGGRNQVRVAGA